MNGLKTGVFPRYRSPGEKPSPGATTDFPGIAAVAPKIQAQA
jgi:hypothetical protein